MSKMKKPALRCAVYTRKSTEEGLDQEFNSLDAQREACEAYVKSQAHEGWRLLSQRYDDGGFSGGTLDRPAVSRLIEDVRRRRVDVIVVYKIDRLTRSLTDFAILVEVLDEHGTSFVSVTQHFNTTTSMGRLTLNVLLSFAQFEREVTGERIRDKIAASKKKGMWMGGPPPLGYDIHDRKLVINPEEARTVRLIYDRYLEVGSVTDLAHDLRDRGVRSKKWVSRKGVEHGGSPYARGALYKILRNPLYRGFVAHRGELYPGDHDAILSEKLTGQVSTRLNENARLQRGANRERKEGMLLGLLRDSDGELMLLHHANKGARRYYYYVSRRVLRHRNTTRQGAADRVPAHAIEELVKRKLQPVLRKDEAGSEREQLGSLLEYVQVSDTHIRIEFRGDIRPSLMKSLAAAFSSEDELRTEGGNQVLVVEASLRKRRGNKVIVAPDGEASTKSPRPNANLVKSLVLAHRWRQEIEWGKVTSMAELAGRENRSVRHVRSMIRLAFLAPDIIEMILEGRQPEHVSLRFLSAQKLPLDWSEQRRVLGLNPTT